MPKQTVGIRTAHVKY